MLLLVAWLCFDSAIDHPFQYLANGQTAKQRHQYEAIYRKTFNYLIYKKQHPEDATEDPFAGLNSSIFKRQLNTNSTAEEGTVGGGSGLKPGTSESSIANEITSAVGAANDEKANQEQQQQNQQQQQQQQPVDATVADLLSVAANDDGLSTDQLPDDDFALFTDDIFAQVDILLSNLFLDRMNQNDSQ